MNVCLNRNSHFMVILIFFSRYEYPTKSPQIPCPPSLISLSYFSQLTSWIDNGHSFNIYSDLFVPLCRLMTEWRLNRGIEEQTKAFLEGFNEVVPLYWIQYFDEKEMEVREVLQIYVRTNKQILWILETSWLPSSSSLLSSLDNKLLQSLSCSSLESLNLLLPHQY